MQEFGNDDEFTRRYEDCVKQILEVSCAARVYFERLRLIETPYQREFPYLSSELT